LRISTIQGLLKGGKLDSSLHWTAETVGV